MENGRDFILHFLFSILCLPLYMTSRVFRYDKPKVIQALRFHFISRKEIKFMVIVINLFALLCAALFFFKVIGSTPFLVSSLMWFFIMIILWFALPLSVYRQSKTFKDEFMVEIDDSGFSIRNERGQNGWDWNAFSSWTESPHFFHLYFNPRAFFIVPKEAFAGSEEQAARAYFTEKIK